MLNNSVGLCLVIQNLHLHDSVSNITIITVSAVLVGENSGHYAVVQASLKQRLLKPNYLYDTHVMNRISFLVMINVG